MTLSDAQRLIARGENGTVEFKRKIRHPEKVIKELVAFANTDGGYLFVGVSDDGQLNGLPFPDDDIYALNQAISNYCRPQMEYEVETIALNEKNKIVVYHVPSSTRKPHYTRGVEEGKQVYVRLADRSIKASKQVSEILERRRKNKDIRFHFGDTERQLMHYLEENQQITLEEFKALAKKNTYQASRTLILMVLANVLDIRPGETEDLYTLKKN